MPAELSITESAAQQIAKQLEKRGHGIGLRLGVRQSGCSGYAYVVDYADELDSDDLVIEAHGVKVIVRGEHLPMLGGISLDYRREGLNAAFKFDNPNVTGTCGCGESFAIGNDAH